MKNFSAGDPRVSVVTPVYNREETLPATLDSVLAQSRNDWEALIIDDGSDDASRQIAQDYAARDARFRTFSRGHQPPGGNACRNIGLDQARGEFMLFLDSDDLLAPHCLERRTRFLADHPQLDFAVFPGLRFTHKPGDSDRPISTNTRTNPSRAIQAHLDFQGFGVTLNSFWRRSSLLEKQLRWLEHLRHLQDSAFHIQAILSGMNFAIVDGEPDCFWRITVDQSISSSSRQFARIGSHLRFYEDILQRIKDSEVISAVDLLIPFREFYGICSKSVRTREGTLSKDHRALLKLLANQSSLPRWKRVLLIHHLFLLSKLMPLPALHWGCRKALPDRLLPVLFHENKATTPGSVKSAG